MARSDEIDVHQGIKKPMTDSAHPASPLSRQSRRGVVGRLLEGAAGWLRHLFGLKAQSRGRLAKQVKDYAYGGEPLTLARQGMYFGSCLIAGYYYDIQLALICFVLCQLTEFLDNYVCASVMRWDGKGILQALRLRNQLLITCVLSASSVAFFAIAIAHIEGQGWHFTPLFFLFAAGLFAAINNHQLPVILAVRLLIYGVAFLYIPLKDLWVLRPPLESELWLQFATVLFVLVFVINCSIIFLKLYHTNLDRLDDLRVERDRAHAAYKIKSQFVSVVSHELRTPLHSIMGSLSLLDSGRLDQDPKRAGKLVSIAHSNSKRLSKLIDDLLDLQKLESGQMTYDIQPVELSELVTEAIESVQGVADSAGVAINFVHAEKNIIALADYSRMQQVMINLVSNALKFSDNGGFVEIRISQSAGMAVLSVSDHGIGIPEESQDLVFGQFSQVDSSDERTHSGSGLGLSIASQIIRAHEGAIYYESELGVGTTFFVEIPLA